MPSVKFHDMQIQVLCDVIKKEYDKYLKALAKKQVDYDELENIEKELSSLRQAFSVHIKAAKDIAGINHE